MEAEAGCWPRSTWPMYDQQVVRSASFSRDRPSCRGGRTRDRTHQWLVRAAVGGRWWARLHLNRPKTPNQTMYLMTMYPVAVRSGRAGR